jgi:hypothetical protein
MTWTVHVHEDAAKQLKAIPPDRGKRVDVWAGLAMVALAAEMIGPQGVHGE